MLWSDILTNWENGIPLKYPKKCKREISMEYKRITKKWERSI